jgi:hypothetical protein
MQPNGNNYWQPSPDDADKASSITEMYAPVEDDNSLDSSVDVNRKPDIGEEPVHWSASEYIHEEKNALWFMLFGVIAIALIAADIFLLKSYTFSALVIVMAVAIVIFSKRPPRIVDYTLSGDQGLYIGDDLHHFSEFRAFGFIKDNGHNSIMLIPTKRFSPGISVYFPDDVGEKIVDILGARLPMKPLKLDAIDIAIRKLRL